MAEGHDISTTTNEYDLEALELPGEQWRSPRRHWWSNQLVGVVPKVTMGLFGGCIMLEIMNTIF